MAKKSLRIADFADKVTGSERIRQILFDDHSEVSHRFRFYRYSRSADRLFALARHTHIIRDPAAPRRPDGQRPYSLARGQMAFWFFLVIASYFFLWIVTGDMDTLNPSVLGLIGISAGTALGSAFVDAAKPAPAGSSGNQPIVDVTDHTRKCWRS